MTGCRARGVDFATKLQFWKAEMFWKGGNNIKYQDFWEQAQTWADNLYWVITGTYPWLFGNFFCDCDGVEGLDCALDLSKTCTLFSVSKDK